MSWALLFGLNEEGAVWVHVHVAIRDMQGVGEVQPGSSPPESGGGAQWASAACFQSRTLQAAHPRPLFSLA